MLGALPSQNMQSHTAF